MMHKRMKSECVFSLNQRLGKDSPVQIDFAFFNDWEAIKSRVAHRLIYRDRNVDNV